MSDDARKEFSPDSRAGIAASFDEVASSYERFDALEREVGDRLLERVNFARRSIHNVIDLGCGTGRCARSLAERFTDAAVSGLDISGGMLKALKQMNGGSRGVGVVRGDFEKIPLADRSVDLVLSNLSLQWASDLVATFREIRRVIKTEGMLLFSMPGDASFPELRAARGAPPLNGFAVQFSNLTEIGDLLMAQGFAEPVMDSEIITLEYPDFASMRLEMAATGTTGFTLPEPHGTGRKTGTISLEILYGTAFGPPQGQPVRGADGEVANFPVAALKSQGNNFAK